MSPKSLWARHVSTCWPLARLKDHVRLVNGFPFDSQVFSDTTGLPLVRIRDLRTDNLPTKVDGRVPPDVILRRGDIVIGMDGDFDSVVWTRGPAALNQRLCLLRARPTLDQRFLAYFLPIPLRAINDVTYFTTVKHLSSIDLLEERLPLPPIETQRAVADVLDAESKRIDSLIAAKRRLAVTIAERRASLRSQAFSHKPGWRLKRLLRAPMAYGVLVPRFADPDEGVPMLRTNCITKRGGIELDQAALIERVQSQEYRRTILAEGDLVLSVVGSMGRSAVATSEVVGANLNRPLARLQPLPKLPPMLLWHWTQTPEFADMARLSTGGDTAQPTLNLGDLAQFHVGLPQDNSTWSGILGHLNDACGKLDATEDALHQQIDLLHEHRQALITSVVTGELRP